MLCTVLRMMRMTTRRQCKILHLGVQSRDHVADLPGASLKLHTARVL